MGDDQQKDITQQAIKDNQKDMQQLQDVGKQAGERAQKDIENLTKGLMNSNNTQKATSQQQNNQLSLYGSKGHGISAVSVISLVMAFAIAMTSGIILRSFFNKRKDRSKGFRIAGYYFNASLFFGIAIFVGALIAMINPAFAGIYAIGVIMASVMYVFRKVTRRGMPKNNKNSKLKANNMEPGVILGAVNGQMIVKPANVPGHVLVNAGSGLGKSQCVAIGSILNWQGSVLAIDIKRELYAYTHHVKEAQGKVIVFDPEQDGHAYDPIKECTDVSSCLFLARSIVPTPKNTPDPMWTMNAQNILAAACYEGHKEGKTLPEIAERILSTEQAQLIDELTNSRYKEAVLLASSVKGTPDRTLGGIFTELKSKLVLFATDPYIKKALSKSEWSPRTLEESATIYLRVSENQVENYRPVWNIIIVQIFRFLTARKEAKNPPILLLLDELPRLGKVEEFGPDLPTVRSKNVTVVSAIQSLAQLYEHYGKDVTGTILDNKTYKLVLGANHVETQKYFSDLAGKHEVKKVSKNAGLGTYGVSNYQQWEERFRPEDFGHLKRPIYFSPNQEALEIDKVFWMQIPHLLNLQKKYGGPTTFINEDNFEEYSVFKRKEESDSNNLNDMSDNKVFKDELIVEKEIEKSKVVNNTDNENDTYDPIITGDITEQAESVDLLEKWDVIR